MDLDDWVEPVDGSFTRFLFRLHSAPQPGGVRKVPNEDQSGSKANTAPKKGSRTDLPQDATVALGLRSDGSKNPVGGGWSSAIADRARGGDAGDCQRERGAGRHLAPFSERGRLRR